MIRKITFFVLLSLMFTVSLNAQNDELLFSPKGIAEIHITLSNGKNINDIKNEKNDQDYAGKIEANMIVKNSNRSTYGNTVLYNGKIYVDGRGNTTWGVPKRPYNIDLLDDAGEKTAAPLLDMPEAEEWCLLAFWHDRSLMRIPIAMYLGRRMNGIGWTPRLRYAELWINGEYRGLYCLSEKVGRGNNRIDVKKLTDAAEDQTEPRITGGYILEGSSEGKLNEREKQVQFRTSRDINFTFKYPKPKNVTPAQQEWIKAYLNEFESVLWGNDFKDPNNGYQKYIDVKSFIDWTILHEQSKGPDILFHASTFVHKDRNKKLNMSSPWDFDLSYGNASDRDEAGNMVRTHRWFDRLSKDPDYLQQYTNRYDELIPLFNQIPQILQANYKQLEDAGVLDREIGKWPQILREYNPEDNQVRPTGYKAHAQQLGEWIMSRNAWCYIILGTTDQEKAARLKNARPVIRNMDPEGMQNEFPFYVKVMKSEKSTNDYKYIWNDSPTSTTNYQKRISQKGKYWVKIVDTDGNISLASDTLYFGVPEPTAIKNINTEPLISFNNPVKNVLYLNYYASQNSGLQIQIIDLNGKKLTDSHASLQAGNNSIEIPISGVSRGIYILRLFSENNHVSKKIIVK